jgi:acyl-coenzyme A thioesterase PaaI-like protein
MPSLKEFLGAVQNENGSWTFVVPTELHGAFGGAFGGIVASCALVAARSAAPGRVPNALDIRFLRGLPAGTAAVTADVLNAGRSLTNVSLDVVGPDGRLCARSTISLVDREVLHQLVRPGPAPGDWKAHSEATQWPTVAPIVSTIDSRLVGNDTRGLATAMKVPWDVTAESSAETASMAADMAVGPPLGSAARGEPVGTPNPDLSLRFCGEVTTDTVVGVGRLDRAEGGIAAVSVEVWSDGELVATGVSTALMIPAR